MPFVRPTLAEQIERLQEDIESRLTSTDPRLRASLLGAFARALGGAMHGQYGAMAWYAKQIVPDQAESEFLERHASWWGVTRLNAAPASGDVTFTGTNGSVIPAGTVVQTGAGTQYSTDGEATIAAGTATTAVTASTGGQTGNAAPGTKLTLVSPVAGVSSAATVAAAGLVGGADIETDDQLRERFRAHVQRPPQGGAVADYEEWAREIPGVTRVWVFSLWLGSGTVGIAFVRDDDASIIPDAGEVAAVQAYIDTVCPVGMEAVVFAPTAAPVNMTIAVTPNTAAVKAAVESDLADLFRLVANVEDGAGSGTIVLSHIRETISLAAGETNHTLVSPAADVTLTAGQIATLGTITWQAP